MSTRLGHRRQIQAPTDLLRDVHSGNRATRAGLITPSDFVRLTSTAAAHAFNLYPRKGVLAPGSDADVIVFDPTARHTISAASHHSRMDTNIYEGRTVTGKARCPLLLLSRVWGVFSTETTAEMQLWSVARWHAPEGFLLCMSGTVLVGSPIVGAQHRPSGPCMLLDSHA